MDERVTTTITTEDNRWFILDIIPNEGWPWTMFLDELEPDGELRDVAGTHCDEGNEAVCNGETMLDYWTDPEVTAMYTLGW